MVKELIAAWSAGCYRHDKGPAGMGRRGRSRPTPGGWALGTGERPNCRRGHAEGGRSGAGSAGRDGVKGAGRRDLWRTGHASLFGGGAAVEAAAAPQGAADEAGQAEGP